MLPYEFLDNMNKYEKNHKPRGCAMSTLALEKYDSIKAKDPGNTRVSQLAKREFQRELAHLRGGISSLKTLNLKK